MHCNSVSHIESRDYTEIYSPFVPYGVVITMLFSTRNIDFSCFDEIVYMQPYPFTLDRINSEIEDAEELIKDLSGYTLKIMLYRDLNQHSGEGDLVGIDQALKEAPDKIKEKLAGFSIADAIEYCVYNSPSDLINVIHGGCGNLSVAISVCTDRFRKYSDRISSDYFYSDYGDYKDILEFREFEKYSVLLQTESINIITKFRKVKGCNDIIYQYTCNYIDMFQPLILDFLEEVYVDIVGDICFWNLDKDLISLKEGAKKVIKKYLLETSKSKEKCPQYESEYNALIRNKLHLDTLFEEKAISLINEKLMDYLHAYLERKEELLSKPFLEVVDKGD